nr:SRPBCC domain-containing protein [Hoeflea prorocentri]
MIVRRDIAAPRERIFKAFTRPELLKQWFTPSTDISVEALTFDFTPNGEFRLRYVMPDGRNPEVAGVFQRIEPPELIAMTWIWQAPDPLENIPMEVTFEFLDKADVTEIVITHKGIPSDTACTIHANGWEGTLTVLAGFLKKETDR